jgi:dipeptidyl aminopeptidase/acylaminoacyl peptidase
MSLSKAIAPVTFGFLCAACASTNALAQGEQCGSLPPAGTQIASPRGLTAEDLAGLRDIGPQYPAGSDRNLFSISPDGQWLAFEIHRANPDTNDYCVALAALPIARVDDRTPQLLDLGGELIPATFRQYGWAALPSGMPMPISPHWAPEGRWIAFLKREHGSTQVWRADLSGSKGRQITRSGGDVEDFRFAGDGRTILFAARPGLAAAEAAIDRESLGGWHFDARAYPVRGARPQTPDTAPVQYRRRDRRSTSCNTSRGRPIRSDTGDSHARNGRVDDAERTHGVGRASGHPMVAAAIARRCPAQRRSSRLLRVRELCSRFVVDDLVVRRWQEAALPPPRRLGREQNRYLRMDSRRRGTAAPLSHRGRADRIKDDLICLREQSRRPRHFVRIDLSSGRASVLFDPNPEFSSLRLGNVERLHWSTATGAEAYGDLVYPVGFQQGRHYPLIVVQYRTRGFLRGGVGDEFPIQAFANRGYFVLSVENPSYEAIVGRHRTQVETAQAFNRDFVGRAGVLSSIEQAVRTLIARGLVDDHRIGITGLSDGSSTVQFAALNSTLFAAGSATGCCWEPTQDGLIGPVIADHFHAVGWPAINDEATEFWSRMSLSRNAGRVAFPILMQAADNEYLFALQSYTALLRAGVPVDLFIFAGEDHVKWQPAHRLAVYRRNMAWFDFWLRGLLPSGPHGQAEAARWATMRGQHASRLEERGRSQPGTEPRP